MDERTELVMPVAVFGNHVNGEKRSIVMIFVLVVTHTRWVLSSYIEREPLILSHLMGLRSLSVNIIPWLPEPKI